MVTHQRLRDARPAKAEMQHVVVFKDRFEHFDDKTCATRRMVPRMVTHVDEVLEVRIQDGGFILRLVADCLTVRVPTALEAQLWADVLWTVFDHNRLAQRNPDDEDMLDNRRFTALWSKHELLPEQPSMTAMKLHEQVSGKHMDAWAAGLKEQPHHHGVLGFQFQSKLTNMYCVLFEDRLDMWDKPAAAASGRRPTDRIVLRSIRSLQTVAGGFIINLVGGKRSGVHVNCAEELRDWSAALGSAISAVGPRTGSRFAGGGGGPRNACLTQLSQRHNQEEEASGVKAASVAQSPGWVPRVATLATKAFPAATKKTLFSDRAVGSKNFACTTHPAAVMRQLKKEYATVTTASVHHDNEVADKISNGGDCQRQPRLPKGVRADMSIADKVTDRSREALLKALSTDGLSCQQSI